MAARPMAGSAPPGESAEPPAASGCRLMPWIGAGAGGCKAMAELAPTGEVPRHPPPGFLLIRTLRGEVVQELRLPKLREASASGSEAAGFAGSTADSHLGLAMPRPGGTEPLLHLSTVRPDGW